ncbi:hypothetical protein J7K97_00970 [Candidatus Aerophobetes bacterium]|nr:hypothetical protein [Candidatus Aerophobetes bacterium]
MNYERRKIIGKMLVDVVKYVLTIVIIGSLLTQRVDMRGVIIGVFTTVIALVLGFLTIPPD